MYNNITALRTFRVNLIACKQFIVYVISVIFSAFLGWPAEDLDGPPR
jgi:hypothetical protein